MRFLSHRWALWLREGATPWLEGTSLLVLLLSGLALGACERASPGQDGPYTKRAPTEGGTGRVYMGREIAAVAGHGDADWLERPTRETAELPNRVINALGLHPDDVVADIGAGTGYFTFRISPKVPHGSVLAVDIRPQMLDLIRERAQEKGVHNVKTVLGTETDPNLPADSVDVVLVVAAYHEFSHPREMMEQIAQALRAGGRLMLVEYRGEDPTVPLNALHKMTEAQVRKEMEAVGLYWRETKDFLPQQHYLVFEKPVP